MPFFLPPINMALLASEQDFATLPDPHSCLVAMLIVVYRLWKTDSSFPSVNSTERDTEEGGK